MYGTQVGTLEITFDPEEERKAILEIQSNIARRNIEKREKWLEGRNLPLDPY